MGLELVGLQVKQIHLVLRILGNLNPHFRPQVGMADGDHARVIRTDPLHRPCAQPKNEADDALTDIDAVIPGIEIAREGDSGQRREEIFPVRHAGNTLHQDRHLFIVCAQAPLAAITQSIGVESAGIHQLDSTHEVIQTGLGVSLVRAKYAAIFPGKGIAKTVLQQAAGAYDNGRLSVIVQHGAKLFSDG